MRRGLDAGLARWHPGSVPVDEPAIATADMPLDQIDFVSVDLETTGIAPGYDRIMEIAAARFTVDAGGAVSPGPIYETLVNPERSIIEEVRVLTGIDDAMVSESPTLGQVWPAFLDWLGNDPATVLLAHGGRFDQNFLVTEGARMCRPWPSIPMWCTLRLSRQHFPEAPSHQLGALVHWLGLQSIDSRCHRALPDALHARNLFAQCVCRTGATTALGLVAAKALKRPDHADLKVVVPGRLVGLEACIEQARTVLICYAGGSRGSLPRPITPLAFYRAGTHTFLRAFCHLGGASRSFRCDRIRGFEQVEAS